MTTKQLMNLVVEMEALALVGDNIKTVKSKKKKLVKQGVKNMVGLALIKETGGLVSGL